MTDRKLLELAAKAAGIGGEWDWYAGREEEGAWVTADGYVWHPLRDDGDALRLAVKLGLCVFPFDTPGMAVCTDQGDINAAEHHGTDPAAATRRAFVRAAAAMAPTATEPDLDPMPSGHQDITDSDPGPSAQAEKAEPAPREVFIPRGWTLTPDTWQSSMPEGARVRIEGTLRVTPDEPRGLDRATA